jgi:hypothetical protein
MGVHVALFDFTTSVGIKISNLDQVVRAQRTDIYTGLLWNQSNHGNTPAFTIAAVVHLGRSSQDMPSGDWNAGSKTQYTTPALGSVFCPWLEQRIEP